MMDGWLDQVLPDALAQSYVAGVPIGHWIAVIIFFTTALVGGFAIAKVLMFTLRKTLFSRSAIATSAALSVTITPLAFIFGISIYRALVEVVGVRTGVLGSTEWLIICTYLVALAWLMSRVVDGIAEIVKSRLTERNKIQSLAGVLLAQRVTKAFVISIALLGILDAIGIDVTTGLAALGIGGLILALGAQKTVENFIGSVTLVADRPFAVGDFCRFGTISGTVEDIGIRSTEIRTTQRTLVTMPNGMLAAMEIENFSARDKMLFEQVLPLAHTTSPGQIRDVTEAIRTLLRNDSRVEDNTMRVRFDQMDDFAVYVSIWAYVQVRETVAFLEIKEDIMLRCMDVLSENEVKLATRQPANSADA